MTNNPRKKLYALLKQRNHEEAALDRPHITEPANILQDLADLCDDETAEWIIARYESGEIDQEYEQELAITDGDTSFMEYFTFQIFFAMPAKKDNYMLLRNIMREMLVDRTGFLPVLQNRPLMIIPKMLNNLIQGIYQRNLDGGIEVSAMEGNRQVLYTLKEGDKHLFTGAAFKMLLILCNELIFRNSNRVYIPLEYYRQRTGKKSIASAERAAHAELNAIKYLDVLYSEKKNGRWSAKGHVNSICTGLARIVGSEYIEFEFTSDFALSVRENSSMLVREKTLQLNPGSAAFFFAVSFDINHRLNEGNKDRENRMKVKTLIDGCPYIDTEAHLAEKGWSAIHHRQKKTLKALEQAGLEYTIVSPQGSAVADPFFMPYAEFMASDIVVSTDYPERNQLLERRRKYAYEQALETATAQEKAKKAITRKKRRELSQKAKNAT